ncbi:MAG TPA: Os1348 family NHLP clan protein [Methanospirillum sp.]|nr:Os1348 family NHLP clan protein [Methanospirillum sp.]
MSDIESIMALEREIYEIIGRAVADKNFRAELMKDPKQATRELGYTLTDEQIASLKESELGQISEELNARISKMGVGGCGVAGLGACTEPM